MDMESAEHLEASWQTFRTQPAAFADPRHIVHAFHELISEELASRLAEENRFRDRLSRLLTEHYTLVDFSDQPPPASVQRVALASRSEFLKLVRKFGAIYWARTIAGVIESKAVVALKQMLGEDAYMAALTHRDLAGPDLIHPANGDLDRAVTSAGLRCLAAWCARQPAGIAQRVRLKLTESAELDEPVVSPFNEVGPRIVDRLITQ